CLGLLAFVVMAGTWSVAAPARTGPPLVAVAGYERAAGLARFRPVAALDALTGVTVVIDGISLATDARPGETVGGLLRSAGIDVETIEEPDQYIGWRSVTALGASGESRVTFLVRVVNGVEAERKIIASEPITAPVPQVVHVGTKVKPAPPPPSEIAAIIRAAAAK